MNTANIKKYAPLARNAFITAVTKGANELGIYDSHIEEAIEEGQVLSVEGRSVDLKLKGARNKLISRVEEIGFTQLMEHIAYTWFNRLCAIRFMELHDYLDHGLRVLSPSPLQGEGWGEGGRYHGSVPALLVACDHRLGQVFAFEKATEHDATDMQKYEQQREIGEEFMYFFPYIPTCSGE